VLLGRTWWPGSRATELNRESLGYRRTHWVGRSFFWNSTRQMREWELGTQEVVRWRNRRGDELEGFLIKPVGYIGGRKYPVIVNAYPQTTIGLYADPMSGGQLLAARGYAVFFPNSRSPAAWMNPFKSADFDLAVRGPNGLALMLDDLNSGMDEFNSSRRC